MRQLDVAQDKIGVAVVRSITMGLLKSWVCSHCGLLMGNKKLHESICPPVR